jgi:AmmeMemoRadiSam system protein B
MNLSPERPSPIAGRWYPGNPAHLRADIQSYLKAATIPQLDGELLGIITPHAGYRYSGHTAAFAYRCLEGLAPQVVAVVSPYHNPTFDPLLTTAHAAYATPLGSIPVATDLVEQLASALVKKGVELVAVANDPEHSLEIQLPFLQTVLTQPFSLLPVMLQTRSYDLTDAVGDSLGEVLKDRQALLVASTDLSHFYNEKTANRLDEEMMRRFTNLDPHTVLRAEEEGSGFACGAAAVAVVLRAARVLGGDFVQLLHHDTSARETGDTSSVVGYGAAAILKKG